MMMCSTIDVGHLAWLQTDGACVSTETLVCTPEYLVNFLTAPCPHPSSCHISTATSLVGLARSLLQAAYENDDSTVQSLMAQAGPVLQWRALRRAVERGHVALVQSMLPWFPQGMRASDVPFRLRYSTLRWANRRGRNDMVASLLSLNPCDELKAWALLGAAELNQPDMVQGWASFTVCNAWQTRRIIDQHMMSAAHNNDWTCLPFLAPHIQPIGNSSVNGLGCTWKRLFRVAIDANRDDIVGQMLDYISDYWPSPSEQYHHDVINIMMESTTVADKTALVRRVMAVAKKRLPHYQKFALIHVYRFRIPEITREVLCAMPGLAVTTPLAAKWAFATETCLRLLLTLVNDTTTALHVLWAASRHNLVQAARVAAEFCDTTAQDHFASRLCIKCESSDILPLLLPHVQENATYSRLLRLAVRHRNIAAVTFLLPFSDPKISHSQILRHAARKGDKAMVHLLLPVCDPTAKHSQALRRAAGRGHLAVVHKLAAYSDVRAKNNQAIHKAFQQGHLGVVRALLPASGLTLGDLGDIAKPGWLPRMRCCHPKDYRFLRSLLLHHGVESTFAAWKLEKPGAVRLDMVKAMLPMLRQEHWGALRDLCFCTGTDIPDDLERWFDIEQQRQHLNHELPPPATAQGCRHRRI